jgi:dienelactone hydrolase
MILRLSLGLLLGVLATFDLSGWTMAKAQQSQAQSPTTPPLLRTYFELPVTIDRQSLRLEAMEIRPRGAGPFPLAVIAHGKASGETGRRNQSVMGLSAQAAAFARRGFVAIVAMRRGYGASQGNYSESDGTCEATRYPQASMTGAKDLAAIVAAAAARPGADRKRIVVAGESVGGVTALALGTNPPPGVLGIINFAGGRGHDPRTGVVCEQQKLIDVIRGFGAAGKVPTLWVYSENDRAFEPEFARQMHKAYAGSGGRGELVVLGPMPRDGHAVFSQGEADWSKPVDGFLKQLGLPVEKARRLPQEPPGLGPNASAAFKQFAGSAYPFRAFAKAPTGSFAWAASMRSLDEARRQALSNCQRSAPVCEIVGQQADIEDR